MGPKRGTERDRMARTCGKKCFAGSLEARSYPICRKGTCRVEDKGLCAALYYAELLGEKALSRKLRKMMGQKKKQGGVTILTAALEAGDAKPFSLVDTNLKKKQGGGDLVAAMVPKNKAGYRHVQGG